MKTFRSIREKQAGRQMDVTSLVCFHFMNPMQGSQKVKKADYVSKLIMIVAERFDNCYANHRPTHSWPLLPPIATHVLPDTKSHNLITKSQLSKPRWDSSNGHRDSKKPGTGKHLHNTQKPLQKQV
jgi:hypothetical protein